MKKIRESTNLDPNLAGQLNHAVVELGISKSAYIAEAIAEKLGKIDRDRDLKRIGKSLGVPGTAAQCIQRIQEREQQLQSTHNTLATTEAKFNESQTELNAVKAQLEAVRAKRVEARAELNAAEIKLTEMYLALKAYANWGFFKRILGIKPKEIVDVRLVLDDRIIQEIARRTTELQSQDTL